jgi:hypothetical protein
LAEGSYGNVGTIYEKQIPITDNVMLPVHPGKQVVELLLRLPEGMGIA